MIRQEALNQIIGTLRLSEAEIKEVPAIIAARLLQRGLQEKSANLRMKMDTLDISVSEFTVNGDGEILINYYEHRTETGHTADPHMTKVDIGNGIVFSLYNTFFTAPSFTDSQGPHRESSFRDGRDSGRLRIRASEHMSAVDLEMLRAACDRAYYDALSLMRGYWNVVQPKPQPNRFRINTIVYDLDERDRLNAAWEYRGDGPSQEADCRMLHLRTGIIETRFSGDFGSEQEWLALRAKPGKCVESIVYDSDESDLNEIITGYVEHHYRTKKTTPE